MYRFSHEHIPLPQQYIGGKTLFDYKNQFSFSFLSSLSQYIVQGTKKHYIEFQPNWHNLKKEMDKELHLLAVGLPAVLCNEVHLGG